MPDSFNPFKWFWLSDNGRVYDSEQQRKTTVSDARYQDWRSIGNVPTRWPQDTEGSQTDAALQEVLNEYGLFVTPPSLEMVRTEVKAAIDAAAEMARQKYITPGLGQIMTYLQKVDEAKAFSSEENPTPSDYPMLMAEVGITAENLSGVASSVLSEFENWRILGAQIENLRLSKKKAADEAQTETDIRNEAINIQWP